MSDLDNELCPHRVFEALPLSELHLSIPVGCAARAQIIGEYLAARGFVVGRAWILPIEGRESFSIPRTAEENTDSMLPPEIATWEYHVAATAQTKEGKPVVFDPLLFDGPVSDLSWQRVFSSHETIGLFLGFYEAPRFRGDGGSCYWPVRRGEYDLDDSIYAQAHMRALGHKLKDPSYSAQPHKPFTAPALANQELAKR